MKQLLLIFLFVSPFAVSQAHANDFSKPFPGSEFSPDSTKIVFCTDTITDAKKVSRKENKRLIAALLAFPVPFGFTGLHRIYLGTEPWIPVVYFATLGGGMILPLIDFFVIVFSSDEELKEFENNPRLFMWVK